MRLHEITPELKAKDRIKKLLEKYFIISGADGSDDYIIDGGFVYVRGSCAKRSSIKVLFDELPIKFGRIGNLFDISDMGLINLNGSPEIIGGTFRCYSNKLTTLQGGPKQVGGTMSVAFNKLTTLEGSPEEVGGIFICRGNKLTNLKGGPKIVGGLQIDNNPLESLEGLPQYINGGINLSYSPTLPLLRLVLANNISSIKFNAGEAAKDLSEILMKYVGKGRAGAIQCAGEMTKAGYKDNAKL